MFPTSNMLHLIQNQSHHETCYKLHPDQCTDDLSFSSSDDDANPEVTSPNPRTTPANTPEYLEDEEEEEDFQTVPLNDDHWTSEEIPERTLCIHEQGLPHGLCPYPCHYANYQVSSYTDSLNLHDISDFEDIMITSSAEDIPALEDMPY